MSETPGTYPARSENSPAAAHISHRYLIAIDPGSHEMGVAVFRDGGLLRTFVVKAPSKVKDVDERAFAMLERLLFYYREWGTRLILDDISARYGAVTLAYENPVYMLIKGQARPIAQLYRFVGHLDQWARQLGWEVYKYPVGEIKLGIAGSYGASKAEVETILRHELNLHEAQKTDHEWDAISVGVYHLQQERIKEAMQ